MDQPATVLFDVDGTLVDSNYQHALAWWEALRQYGHTVPLAFVHRAVGMGTDQLLDRLLGEQRDPDETEALAAAHQALAARFWPSLTALPGARDLIRLCARHHLNTVLASSASARELDVLRKVLDADDAITAATSSDDIDQAKPEPDVIGTALKRVHGDPAHSVMIGDAVWDVRAAERAGVPCIAVLTGGSSRRELQDAGAVEVYETPAELVADFNRSMLARTAGLATR
jgi:phosphoglycolate phosphatase-like HAD superfamily hydrolase